MLCETLSCTYSVLVFILDIADLWHLTNLVQVSYFSDYLHHSCVGLYAWGQSPQCSPLFWFAWRRSPRVFVQFAVNVTTTLKEGAENVFLRLADTVTSKKPVRSTSGGCRISVDRRWQCDSCRVKWTFGCRVRTFSSCSEPLICQEIC
jgi:hypothetical protein